jgi:hypothetical protein
LEAQVAFEKTKKVIKAIKAVDAAVMNGLDKAETLYHKGTRTHNRSFQQGCYCKLKSNQTCGRNPETQECNGPKKK